MSQPKFEQWHVTWAAEGRLPVAPEEERRRALARGIVSRAKDTLVLFAVVDDHIHVWLYGTREKLARAVRALDFLVRGLAATELEEPHEERVRKRRHSENLFPYLLTQTEHHALHVHPATWSGAAAADLLGARDLGWRSRLWDALPKLTRRDVHAAVGPSEVELVPASDEEIAARGLERLVSAAAAAFAAPAGLAGKSPASVLALRVAAQLAREVGFLQRDLAALVGRDRGSITRLLATPAPPKAIRTVRLRVALEIAAATARIPPRAPPPWAFEALEQSEEWSAP